MLNVRNIVFILIYDFKEILNKAAFYTLIFMFSFSLFFTNLYGGLGIAFALLLTEIFFSLFITYY